MSAVAGAALMAGTARAVPIVTLDFNVTSGGSGTISYAGGAAPLVGTGVHVDTVTLLDANGNQLGATGTCIGCVLEFSTGNFTGTTAMTETWNFAGGGMIKLVGGIDFDNDGRADDANEPGPNSVLFDGSFGGDGGNVMAVSGTYKIATGSFQDLKDPTLLAFYGLPANVLYDGGFNLSFNAPGSPGDSFVSTRMQGGDIMNMPTPEPATLLLLAPGLATFGYLNRRRRKAHSPT